MIASFAESLEARLSLIDHRFSQVMTSFAYVTQSSDVSCQDVISNCSFSAPSPVAVRIEHPLIGVPLRRIQTTWEPP